MIKLENIKESDINIKNIWSTMLELGIQQEFTSGDIIYKQCEPSSGLVCFQEGKIKLYTLLPDGIERTICMVGTPHILCETSVIDGGTNICTAMALAKTKVVFISNEKVKRSC
ncbi:Crp/Fnr family transcriptional regulator [Desulfitobacterium sp. AusDCA]|uniref:Crp/Fnr family transcriptional regulator n=1 Tax=Desulfitobacterium sp. AusDCA TaxID=3240383 RepID=UPI003DA79812